MLSGPRIAALAAFITLALTGSASAASLSISLTPEPSDGGTFTYTATLTGSADTTSYLFAYAQPASIPCAATPSAEQNMNPRYTSQPITVPGGSFSQTVSNIPLDVGRGMVCGYLSSPPSDPHAPGPLYKVPDAAAVSNVVTVNPCTPKTFSIESVDVDPTTQGPEFYPSASLTLHADGPGGFDLTDLGTGREFGGPAAPAAGTVTMKDISVTDVKDSDKGKARTETYAVTFRPQSSTTCTLPDGTVDRLS
ncbi:MAG TPA: hypothetical protein VIL64_03880, partial [Solirubrobacteraceae bacterium]